MTMFPLGSTSIIRTAIQAAKMVSRLLIWVAAVKFAVRCVIQRGQRALFGQQTAYGGSIEKAGDGGVDGRFLEVVVLFCRVALLFS